MRTRNRLISILLTAILFVKLLSPVIPVAGASAALLQDSSINAQSWEVLRLVNQYRMSLGLQPLSTCAAMQKVANQRAYELNIDYRSDHTRPDGSLCFSAFFDYGAEFWSAGENIAAGYTDAASVVAAWLNSGGHRQNIEDADFTHMGVGCYHSYYWTQDFIGHLCTYTAMRLSSTRIDCKGMTLEQALRAANVTVTLTCAQHGECMLPLIAAMCTGYRDGAEELQNVTVRIGNAAASFTVPAVCKTHEYDAGISVPPTCTEAGYLRYTCVRCGQSKTTYAAAALGHSFEKRVCTRCGLIAPENTCNGGTDCPSRSYLDAPAAKNWAHAGIDFCIKNRFMSSTSSTEAVFCPEGTLTRAQLVTILYRVAGSPKVPFQNAFVDVPQGKWYSAAIEWAAKHQIVAGIGTGRFDPDGSITREQIATILYRYAGSPQTAGSLSAFPDQGQVGSYAKKAMCWAIERGLITGSKKGNVTLLAPKDHASRAQIAAIIMRYLGG